jgi:hypothetical protein
MAELQNGKNIMWAFYTVVYSYNKILARCYGLKVFFLNINSCLKHWMAENGYFLYYLFHSICDKNVPFLFQLLGSIG